MKSRVKMDIPSYGGGGYAPKKYGQGGMMMKERDAGTNQYVQGADSYEEGGEVEMEQAPQEGQEMSPEMAEKAQQVMEMVQASGIAQYLQEDEVMAIVRLVMERMK